MVPYALPCVCKGCARPSADKPWGCYKYDAVLKQWQPAEDGSQDCMKTLQDALAPQKLTWKVFGARLQEPQTAATFQDWRRRSAGMPTDFDKSAATTDEDFEVTWIDDHLPQTKADLEAAYPTRSCPRTSRGVELLTAEVRIGALSWSTKVPAWRFLTRLPCTWRRGS